MSTQQAASNNAHQILDLTLAEAHEAGRADLIARLEGARRLLVDPRVRVQVIGAPRQGKSALIEALQVASRHLPAEGRHPAQLELSEGRPAPAGAAKPALGERPVWRSTETLAHAVLFVSDASRPLTEAEIDQLRWVVDKCPTTMFVLTKIDSHDDWYQVLEHNQALLGEAGIGVETWAVSSVGRLRGEWSGDHQLNGTSGIPLLRGQLAELCADFERTSLRAVAHHVLGALGELRNMLHRRRAELSEPGSVGLARDRAADLEQRLGVLRDRAVRWPALLSNGFATANADTDLDLRRRTQQVRSEVTSGVAGRHPVREWEVLTHWLRQRLSHEAAGNQAVAVSAARAFSQRAAAHFGLARPHDPAAGGVPVMPEVPVAPPADRALPPDPVMTLSAGMNLLMRGWIGFIMFFMLNSVIGLGLPSVAALVPVALFTATGVIEEWKGRLGRRRNQANAALDAYIDDFVVATSNANGELLRELEQRLRESYGRLIDRDEEGLSAAHARAEHTLHELEGAPALVAEIDDGLRSYDELARRASGLVAAQMLETSN